MNIDVDRNHPPAPAPPPPSPRDDYPAWTRDDDLVAATAADGVARVRVWRPTRTEVVLGRGSRPALELRLDAVAADGVPVLRRRGGGCAVVLDPGNVVVSLALPAPGIGDNPRWFRRISDWLIAALADLGHDGVRQEGISDLVQDDRAPDDRAPDDRAQADRAQADRAQAGSLQTLPRQAVRKIGGSALYRAKGLLYYSTTLLAAPDVSAMERWLAHPPREPDYRRGRRHADFVGALAPPTTPAALAAGLTARLDPATIPDRPR